jgi:hypothetical protein
MAKHWSDGRIVVIRPDVPGKHFDPNDSWLLRTDEDRAAADRALSEHYDEVRARQAQGLPPSWAEPVMQATVEPISDDPRPV